MEDTRKATLNGLDKDQLVRLVERMADYLDECHDEAADAVDKCYAAGNPNPQATYAWSGKERAFQWAAEKLERDMLLMAMAKGIMHEED